MCFFDDELEGPALLWRGLCGEVLARGAGRLDGVECTASRPSRYRTVGRCLRAPTAAGNGDCALSFFSWLWRSSAGDGKVLAAVPDHDAVAFGIPVEVDSYGFCDVLVGADFEVSEHFDLLALVLEGA